MSKLTILQYLTKKNKLTREDLIKLIAGKTLETTRSSISNSGHNYPAKFKVAKDLNNRIGNLSNGNIVTTSTTLVDIAVDSNGKNTGRNSIHLHELLTPTLSIVDLKEDLEALEAEKQEIKSKIELLSDLGLEEYDEKIIKICNAVSVVNPKLTGEEKLKFAQAINDVV